VRFRSLFESAFPSFLSPSTISPSRAQACAIPAEKRVFGRPRMISCDAIIDTLFSLRSSRSKVTDAPTHILDCVRVCTPADRFLPGEQKEHERLTGILHKLPHASALSKFRNYITERTIKALVANAIGEYLGITRDYAVRFSLCIAINCGINAIWRLLIIDSQNASLRGPVIALSLAALQNPISQQTIIRHTAPPRACRCVLATVVAQRAIGRYCTPIGDGFLRR